METAIPFLGADRPEKGDLYLPDKDPLDPPRPAIVVIHGGSWDHGDRTFKQYPAISRALADAGYVVFCIDYKLSTAASPIAWPQNLQDCKTAVRWLRKNAAQYAIDPNHIGALGGSTGGLLSSMVALTGSDAALNPSGPYGEYSCAVQAAVDLYGVVELNKRDLPMFGKTRAEAPELYEQASPLAHITRDEPPILIIHGSADKNVSPRHSQIFAEALKKAGATYDFVMVPGAEHSFDLQPKERDLRPLVCDFFKKYLMPGSKG